MNLIDRLIAADYTTPKRIAVIGDSMADHYVQGYLEGECQEGCLKFVEQSRTVVPGGAANAARSLTNWHARVVFFGSPYESVKTRFMVEDRCVFRCDKDRTDFNYEPARQAVIRSLNDMYWQIDAMLLSDYDKGMLTPEFIAQMVRECKKRDIPIVADAKREPEVYEGCILKCNDSYYEENFDEVRKYIKDWVVTYGSRLPYVQHIKGETLIDYLQEVKCVNHVGAGDCFAAHLTLALAYGFSLKEAAVLAHSAGRVYVQHRYNKPPCLDEIRRDMVGCEVSVGVTG